jgi:homogentisate 1,2-dioxygenase
MFESSRPFTLTEYAWTRCGVKHEHEPKMWDPLRAEFMDRLDVVNADLKRLGLPELTNKPAAGGAA